MKENFSKMAQKEDLTIRSRTPYPLSHAASHRKACKQFFALNSDKKLKQFSYKFIETKGFTRVSLAVNLSRDF